jgi:hypothetical protein
LKPRAVAKHTVDRCWLIDFDAHALRIGNRLNDVECVLHDVAKIDQRAFQSQLSRRAADNVEQVVDELCLSAGAVSNAPSRSIASFIVECAAAQLVRPPEYRVVGRAKLVRHDPEELILHPVCVFSGSP